MLAISLAIPSCGQTSSHQDHVYYYTTIALHMKDIAPKVNSFWKQMKQGVWTAFESQNMKLEKASLDTLKSSFYSIMLDLDAKIKSIDSLKETDKNLMLKEAVVSYLTETKTLQGKAIPKVLELLHTGLDRLTNDQKGALQEFSSKGRELEIRSNEIENLSLKYQAKYKITNEELKKYGL